MSEISSTADQLCTELRLREDSREAVNRFIDRHVPAQRGGYLVLAAPDGKGGLVEARVIDPGIGKISLQF